MKILNFVDNLTISIIYRIDLTIDADFFFQSVIINTDTIDDIFLQLHAIWTVILFFLGFEIFLFRKRRFIVTRILSHDDQSIENVRIIANVHVKNFKMLKCS